MKTQIATIKTVSGRTIHYLDIPDSVIKELGWKECEDVTIDIPLTGGGLRVTRVNEPLPKVLGGVKERSNG